MQINTQWLNLLLILCGLVMVRLPYIGVFFRAVCTLIHESSHAFCALVFSQQIMRIELNHNLSGSALISGGNRFTNILTSLAGYFGASLMALLFMYLISKGHYQPILYCMLPICVVNLVFWVRNLFGIIWVLLQIVAMALLIYYHQVIPSLFYVGLISSCLLSESLYSAFVILKLSFTEPKKAGDSALLAKFTHIPAEFWGIVFFLQAAALYVLSMLLVLNPWLNVIN